jgi:hypothetical protein
VTRRHWRPAGQDGAASIDAAGVGVGAGAFVGVGFGFTVGFGVGLGVGRGVALGFGAPAQLLTPEPETRPVDAGTWYFATGCSPGGGNSFAARARIAFVSGIWIDPRAS